MKIKVMTCGGTIACHASTPTSEFYPPQYSDISPLFDAFPDVNIVVENHFQKMSHEISLVELLALAKNIQTTLDDDYDGIVITCGTNAIEEMAYFVGLVVKTEKAIVFTGAHFPQHTLGFDGKKNLYNALVIASSPHAQKLGVLLTFNDYVVTARDALKITPGLSNTFLCEEGLVGHVIGNILKVHSIPTYRHTFQSEFDIHHLHVLPSVIVIYAFLGIDDMLVRAALSAQVAGIVSAGFGKGYQPEIVTKALQDAVLIGTPVVRCARTGVSYSNSDPNYDEKYGFIISTRRSPHKSSILLSLCLSVSNERKWIQQVFEDY